MSTRSGVSFRYASAIYDIANNQGKLEQVKSDFQNFNQLCEASRDFYLFLKSPVVKALRKLEILKKLFSSEYDKVILEFMSLVCKKNRAGQLKEIAESFASVYNIRKGIEKASVLTAMDLTDITAKELEKLAKKVVGDKELELEYKIEPSLIGGFLLKVEDKQMDQTVSTKLKKIKKELSK